MTVRSNKAVKLKEMYEKGIADSKAKGKFDGTKGPAKVARKTWKRKRRRRKKRMRMN